MIESTEELITNSIRDSKVLTSEYIFKQSPQIVGDYLGDEFKRVPPFNIQLQASDHNKIIISLEMPASKSDILSFSRLPKDIRLGILEILENRIEVIGFETSSNGNIITKLNNLIFTLKKEYDKTYLVKYGILKTVQSLIYGLRNIHLIFHDFLFKVNTNLDIVIKGKICFDKLLVPLENLGKREKISVFKVEDAYTNEFFLFKEVPIPENEVKEKENIFQKLKSINHPNITSLHSLHVEGKRLFILKRFIEGNPLMYNTKMDFKSAFKICYKIGLALNEFHTNGLIHLDIKHDNIILDFKNEPIIIDLDTVNLLGSATCKWLIGTLRYMGPEIVDPNKMADVRSDIFSLGVVIYELIYGVFPHRFIENILNFELPKTLKNSTKETDIILAKMLDPEIDKRYQNCLELISDVEKVLHDTEPLQNIPWYLSGSDVEGDIKTANILWSELSRIKKAEEIFIDVIEKENNIRAYIQLGKLLVEKERFEEAEEVLAEGSLKNPESFDLWSDLGHNRHNNLSRYNEALEAYEEVKELSPYYSEVYSWIGSCYERTGNLNSAESNYKKSLELSPGNENNFIRYVGSLAKQNKYSDALIHIDTFLKNNKASANILATKANILIKVGRYLEAARIFASFTKANKNYHFAAGSCYFKANHYQEALTHLNQIYNIPQHSIKSLEMIVPSQFYLKSYEQSCNAAGVLLQVDSKNICAIEYKSKSLLTQGLTKECLEFLSNYEEIVEANLTIQMTFISALNAEGNLDEADKKVEQLLKQYLNSDVFMFAYKYYAEKMKDEKKADDIINGFIADNNKLKSEYLFKRASDSYKKGDLLKALTDAKSSTEALPTCWHAYEIILRCYHALNQPDKVVGTMKELQQKLDVPEKFSMRIQAILSAFAQEAINSKDDNKLMIYNLGAISCSDKLLKGLGTAKKTSQSRDSKLIFEFIEEISKCEILFIQNSDADYSIYSEEFEEALNKSIKIAEGFDDIIARRILLFLSYCNKLFVSLDNEEALGASSNQLSKYIIRKEEVDKFVIDLPPKLIEMLISVYKMKVRGICIFIGESINELKENNTILNIFKLFTQLNIELNGTTEESLMFDAIVTYHQGDYRKAAEIAAVALEMNPNNNGMLLLKCDAECNYEAYEDALETINLYISHNGRDIKSDVRLISIFKKLKRFRKAEQIEKQLEKFLKKQKVKKYR
jgi:tetratricopeptide (TPR) repeat protein